MGLENWQIEMQHLFEIFQRESITSLRKINRHFFESGHSFDQKFRQYFLKWSTQRLNTSFDIVLFEHDSQMQTTPSSSAPTNDNQVANNPNTFNSTAGGDVDGPNGSQNDGVMNLKIENDADATIVIVDSDDEGDNDDSGMPTVNDANEDQTGSNESVESNNGTANPISSNNKHLNIDSTIENGTDDDIKRELKIESANEMMDLPFVEFDPNKASDRSNAENEAAVTAAMNDQSEASSSSNAQKRLKNPTVKLFECKDCAYTSRHKGHFERHRLIHGDIKPFKCKQCDYAARLKAHLEGHQRIHATQKSIGVAYDQRHGLYKCTHCAQQFPRWENFMQHFAKSHKNNRRLFNCVHCLRRFTQMFKKEKHEIRCENRRYECHLCKQYVTRSVTDMQKHMRTHSGAKPFECAICKRCFRQKSNLKSHLDSVHSCHGK